jgi:hypothetical protein
VTTWNTTKQELEQVDKQVVEVVISSTLLDKTMPVTLIKKATVVVAVVAMEVKVVTVDTTPVRILPQVTKHVQVVQVALTMEPAVQVQPHNLMLQVQVEQVVEQYNVTVKQLHG